MLATVGDLVEDVAVRLSEPIHVASDTEATITRRRGGSAANVAVCAAEHGHPSRFIGNVGTDPTGNSLIAAMASVGVDTSAIRRSGSTGTIVVLVDVDGERSMLTDRRSCLDLTDPDPHWLDAVTTLHVPFYSLTHGSLAATSSTLIEWSHARGIPVSIDVSSAAVLRTHGIDSARALIGRLDPVVVFANHDEAVELDLGGPIGNAITVIKRGADPATVFRPGHEPAEVAAASVIATIDSTGAGDAFAAGFLSHPDWITDPVAACRHGHRVAATVIAART